MGKVQEKKIICKEETTLFSEKDGVHTTTIYVWTPDLSQVERAANQLS